MISYGTSQLGTEHKRLERDCQDNFFIKVIGNYHVAVVADGLGSAVYSKTGSYEACEYAVNTITDLLNSGDVQDTVEIMKIAFSVACAEVLNQADAHEIPVNQFETTLSAVIADEKSITYGHVGDGGIAVLRPDGSFNLITSRQNGLYEDSVFPLISKFNHCVFERIECDWNVIMMATDGMLKFLSAFSDNENCVQYVSSFFNRAFSPTYANKRQLESYLVRSLSDESLLTYVDDDRTLAFIVNESNPLNTSIKINLNDSIGSNAVSLEQSKIDSNLFTNTCKRFNIDTALFIQHIQRFKISFTDNLLTNDEQSKKNQGAKHKFRFTAILIVVILILAVVLVLCTAIVGKKDSEASNDSSNATSFTDTSDIVASVIIFSNDISFNNESDDNVFAE